MNQVDTNKAHFLLNIIHRLAAKGHLPAKAGNFSFRSHDNENLWISQTGIHKSVMGLEHFILTKKCGGPYNKDLKTSAETLIHTSIYDHTTAGAIIHGHHINALLFADLQGCNQVLIKNQEMLKAFDGHHSHEDQLSIPIYDNTQDMVALSAQIREDLKQLSRPTYALIIRDHGLYVWGDSPEQASLHEEALDYLFTLLLGKKNGLN